MSAVLYSPVLAAALVLSLLPSAYSYTWNFQSNPQQCSNLTINISGNDGKPPFRVLIIPTGASPFSDGTEVRKIIDRPFDSDTQVSFQLNYPANSHFVAVVSDSSGFGSGGTSAEADVTSSDNTSCFDPSKGVSPLFGLSDDPPITQCKPSRLFWDKSLTNGTVHLFGVIPGGNSFAIPANNLDDESAQGRGTGFNWTANVRVGTTLIIAAGDDRGNGTGGSIYTTVQPGSDTDGSCLNSQSPSSTAGSPAGGSYPTGTGSPSNGGGGGGGGGGGSSGNNSTNVGAIVGGVIGGVVALLALLLVLLFFRRRQRHHQKAKTQPVDLLHSDEGDETQTRQTRNELPQYYQPEPFIVPDPTQASSDDDPEQRQRRESMLSSTDRSGTPDLLSATGGSSTTRKGGYQRSLRPVNIIQHDDAGPSEAVKEEPETIELPPAYTNIKTTSTPPAQAAA